MDIVFLGVNGIGWEIYEWLRGREPVSVRAMITSSDQLELMKIVEPDVAVAAGFGEIVPSEFLQIPEHGCINVHPGYLPHARGYNPNVWSIVEGQPPGVSIHFMEEDVDAGGIIARRKVESSFEDTGKTLYQRMERVAVELFKDTWPNIESNNIDPIEQDDQKATTHVKRDFIELREIDPDETFEAKELLDILRALTYPPFENAWMEVDDTRYTIEVEIDEMTGEDVQEGFTSSY